MATRFDTKADDQEAPRSWLEWSRHTLHDRSTRDFEAAYRTDVSIARLLWLGFWVLLLLVVYGLSIDGNGPSMRFIGWSVGTAFASIVVGIGLGLLFGLPTKKVVEIRRTAAPVNDASPPVSETPVVVTSERPAERHAVIAQSRPVDDARDIPYEDSTSLEQIADWLTKIIVGLALTQFPTLRSQFEALAENITINLFSGELSKCLASAAAVGDGRIDAATALCRTQIGGAAPGGILVAGYCTLGFIVAYLWMRRHFITEMIWGRIDAERIMALRSDARMKQIEAEKKAAEAQLALAEADVAKARADAEAEKKAGEARAMQAEVELARAKADAEAEKRATEAAVRRAEESAAALAQLDKDKAAAQIVQAPYAPGAPDAAAARPIAETAAQIAPTGSLSRETAEELIATLDQTVKYPDDPWRGQFGGQSSANGYTLSAAVRTTADPATFEIDIFVDASDEHHAEVAGKQSVIFFLHPTFGSEPRRASFDSQARASLKLFAYGAFTVGAITEDGTRLELNLAVDERWPVEFRQR